MNASILCKMGTIDDKIIAIIDRSKKKKKFFFFCWGIRSGSGARRAQCVRKKKEEGMSFKTRRAKKNKKGKKKNMTVKTKSGTSLITRVLRLKVVNNPDWFNRLVFFFFCFPWNDPHVGRVEEVGDNHVEIYFSRQTLFFRSLCRKAIFIPSRNERITFRKLVSPDLNESVD